LISFRYHLVSIVAVFLALALGVVMGTTVVKQGVIEQLRSRTDAAVKTTHLLQQEVNQLRTDVNTWEKFSTEAQPILVTSQLSGEQVVMVTIQGVDLPEVDGVRRALQQSGATVVGILEATSRMALTDSRAQSDMAAVLGVPVTDQATLAAVAARTLGERLASGPPVASQDPLQQFINGDFVSLLGGSGSAAALGASGQLFVFVAGGTQTPAVSPETFLVPVLTQLVNQSRPTAAVETEASTYPFVSLIRADGSLNGHLTTVDNADTGPGRVAVVLGLRDLLRNPAAGGNYGVKSGSSRVIPSP